jgi:hypothetical protein
VLTALLQVTLQAAVMQQLLLLLVQGCPFQEQDFAASGAPAAAGAHPQCKVVQVVQYQQQPQQQQRIALLV